MLLRRTLGTETEFSVARKGASLEDFIPVQIISEYGKRRRWPAFGSVEVGGCNLQTPNGGRWYPDVGSHPEYSTCETDNPLLAAIYDKSGERLQAQAMQEFADNHPEYGNLRLFKNNTDGNATWARHINVLALREIEMGHYAEAFMPYLVSAQVIGGSGFVMQHRSAAGLALSQRSLFFFADIGSATTRMRPIFNTKDEALCDQSIYRRLHQLPLDSNVSEVATFLVLGMLVLVAEMAECGCAPGFRLALDNPVRAIRQICLDPTLKQAVQLYNGKTITGLGIQREYHLAAERHLFDHRQQLEPWHRQFLKLNAEVLDGLERDPFSQRRRILWVLKQYIIENKVGGNYAHPKARQHDLDISRLWPKGRYQMLADQGRVDRLFTDVEVAQAMVTPPTGRPFARVRLRKAFPGIAGSGWDYVGLMSPGGSFQRINLPGMQSPFGPPAELVNHYARMSLSELYQAFGLASQPAA